MNGHKIIQIKVFSDYQWQAPRKLDLKKWSSACLTTYSYYAQSSFSSVYLWLPISIFLACLVRVNLTPSHLYVISCLQSSIEVRKWLWRIHTHTKKKKITRCIEIIIYKSFVTMNIDLMIFCFAVAKNTNRYSFLYYL